RDARISGPAVASLVNSTLISLGIDVTDIGLASTPTVEVAVTGLKADGGIIITASHNPAEWNALKLLNEKGEFISSSDGEELLSLAAGEAHEYSTVGEMGQITYDDSWNRKHVEMVVSHHLVDREAVSRAGLTVAVDSVNSVGGLIMPLLLQELGVKNVISLYGEPTGIFPHNPEPLPENLIKLSETVVSGKADIGMAVDPDVDRLAIVCENGMLFGEEYTLVAVADYVLGKTRGSTVSNMSSSRALRDVTGKHGCNYYSSPVGEVNVVEEMKKRQSVIGGEGNGGVILPDFHYGRDAVMGAALFLSHMVSQGISCSALKKSYPAYEMIKRKIDISSGIGLEDIFSLLEDFYKGSEIDRRDGIRIENDRGWVHLRASNTEPIIRIYSESETGAAAEELVSEVISLVKKT
ncbi:MAG: phosphoglucosamine mutase, partial [Bacteroidales bacterium]